MNKKKILVIAIILFLGLGTFVFANPSTAYQEEDVGEQYQDEEDGKGLDEDTSGDVGSIASETRTETDTSFDEYRNSLSEREGVYVRTFAHENINMTSVMEVLTGGGNSNGGNSSTNYPSGGGNGSTGGSVSPDVPIKPVEPVNPVNPSEPDTPVEPVNPDNPNVPDTDIKKLVQNLEAKVKTAKSREDILNAISYRDKENIIAKVSNMVSDEKESLQRTLDEINMILNDTSSPVISGVENQSFIRTDASISILEENLLEIKVNEKSVPLNHTFTFQQEGRYEILVTDKAYNTTVLTFTIDKTAPIYIVETSNDYQKTNQDVTVTIKSLEALKPLDGWVLSSDRKSLSKVFSMNTVGSVVISDLASNEILVEYRVFDINKDIPALVDGGISYSTRELTNGDVEVIITTTKSIFTPPNGWEMVEHSRVFRKIFKQNEVEKVLLKDDYKNINYITIEVQNIDKTPPKASFVVSPSKKTNQSVVGKIISDETFTIEENGWVLGSNQKEATKVFSENGYFQVVIKDLAGNTVIVPCVISNIDREVSGIKVTTSNQDHFMTNQDVIVTISATEELREIGDGWVLSNDKKSVSKVFSSNISSSVVITDLLGNEKEVEYKVFDINKEKPEISDISYELTDEGKVKVTIVTNRSIFAPYGWAMVRNSKVFTKEYSSSVTDTIRLKDGYYNSVDVVIHVDVEKMKAEVSPKRAITDVSSTILPVVSSVADAIQSAIY